MWPWAPSAPPPPAEAPRISRERPVLRAPATATAIATATDAAAATTTDAAAATTTDAAAAPTYATAIAAATTTAHNETHNDSTTTTANANAGTKPTRIPSVPWTGHPNERLSMPLEVRGPVLLMAAFAAGLGLGGTRGGQLRADRYRAENAHRYPTTEAGWYLYQRSKNYHMMLGICSAGVRSGVTLSLWAAGFMATEEGIDQLRARLLHRHDDGGQRDFMSTAIAALAVAGVHSRVHRMNTFATVKSSKMALKAGLAFGLAQDALACLRGGTDVPAYLRWLRPVATSTSTSASTSASASASASASTSTSTKPDEDVARL